MVSVEQAAINALKTFLASQLSDVTISEVWPNPDQPLPAKAITIVKIGQRHDTKASPELVGTADTLTGDPPEVDPILKAYTWRVGLVEQSLQLDIWSCYQAVRDDIDARLDAALRAGPAITLATLSTEDALNADDFRDGLLLALTADSLPGIADFAFEGSEIGDTPESVQREEFRATRLGSVAVPLTITKIQPRLAQVGFTITAYGVTDTPTAT